jgi:hypothetical protein
MGGVFMDPVEGVVVVKRALEPKLKEEVKPGRPPKNSAESAEGLKVETRDIVARLVGEPRRLNPA